jgi:tRNA U34 2-thiouridine synthase MnmA/TrmU
VQENNSMTKALGLMSGGLDSTLAAMVLMRQGIDVTGISFVTPFFGAEKARKAAEALGHPLIITDISVIHLEMLKQPKYGFGRHMNPCIDCHAMMFRLAGEKMQEARFDFLFSGEVLRQRPMSQNATALKAVARHSGFDERILRPLSARLLPPTEMEEQGLVDRTQLLDIQGRSRKRQQALAREWGLKELPATAGGCRLTERGFSNQLRDLLSHDPAASVTDVELLKIGRQFRLNSTAKLVVGRNQEDNLALEGFLTKNKLLLRCQDFSGPLGVLCGNADQPTLECAAAIVASYSQGKDEPLVEVLCFAHDSRSSLTVPPMPREESIKMLLR